MELSTTKRMKFDIEVSSYYFNYEKDSSTFTAEISELPAEFQNNFFEDGFFMISQKTGNSVYFRPFQTLRDEEGDIRYWSYECKEEGFKNLFCVIFND
jgi:hypothetical protein